MFALHLLLLNNLFFNCERRSYRYSMVYRISVFLSDDFFNLMLCEGYAEMLTQRILKSLFVRKIEISDALSIYSLSMILHLHKTLMHCIFQWKCGTDMLIFRLYFGTNAYYRQYIDASYRGIHRKIMYSKSVTLSGSM